MLKETEVNPTEIAKMCGYPSLLQYMYAVFQRHFSQTPKEYRNGHTGIASNMAVND
jgi:LacI family transcriptional regulator